MDWVAVIKGDVWDFFTGAAVPESSLPVGVILTCPATGSESSAVTVVNNTEEGKKLLVSHPLVRPVIAFMKSGTYLFFISFSYIMWCDRHVSHVCERYFTPDDEIGVIDRMSEGILKTLVDLGLVY